MSEENTLDFKEPNLPEGLVLFFHPKNLHSQKVLFVLHEKNIRFTPHALDLANGEQYSSWFLNKNPKGEVPVLQDNALIIPNSNSIINYIEGKFKGEKYPPLIPTDRNSSEYKKSVLFEEILRQLPVAALSLGSLIHEDLRLNPKPPFIGTIRQSCIENNEKVYEILKKSTDEAVSYKKSVLQDKLYLHDRRKQLVYSRVEYQRILDQFEEVLKKFEEALEEEPEREWLLSSEFYAIDITFGLLLHRLYSLGFEDYFWTNGKLPKVRQYLSRFRHRPVFKKVIPSNVGMLKTIWSNTPPQYKLGAGVIGAGAAMLAAFAHKDSIAIVTASTDGIGFSIAKRLAEDGANVVISSRKQNNVDSAVDKLKQLNLEVLGVKCHVGLAEDRKTLFNETMKKYGKLNILVSNAATNPAVGGVLDCDESVWDKIFDINVKSSFLLAKEALPHLRKSKGSSIVFVSSIAGYDPFELLGAYSVSKTALIGLTKAAAKDLAREGIRINCLAPGVIRTKFSKALYESESALEEALSRIPLGRLGESDEMAGVVSFLVSDDASYITGEAIVASGGMTSRL